MVLLSESADNKKLLKFGMMRPLVLVGLLVIGLTRIEDRAMIGVPGLAPDAMAAMAIQPSENDDGSFADEPAGVVPLSGVGQVPRDRIRRALRDRDFANAAAQGAIPALIAPGAGGPSVTGTPGDNPAAQAALDAFTPALDSAPANLASAAPALLSPGNNVFSANLPQADGGDGAGNGGGGGSGGGAVGGGTETPPGQGAVAAIPEPESWFFLILGFYAIGTALRYGKQGLAGARSRQVFGP